MAGVGANYTFTVTVGGGDSNASTDALSYASPVINSLTGPGATGGSAAGGATIFLNGSNFGPADGSHGTTVVSAWAIPSVNSSLAFPASACRVTTAHTTITCTVGAGVGAALSWRVVVEGQSNAVPQSSYALPTLLNASWVEASVSAAATTGGTLLSIVGVDLGPAIDFVAVTITVLAGDTPVPRAACTMPRPDVEVVCALPAGTGAITRIGVSVLEQVAWLNVTGLGYAPPVVTTAMPGTWGTDLASVPVVVTVTGSGFGSPSQSSLVVVTAMGVAAVAAGPGCGGLPINTTLVIPNVNVRSDRELVFEARYSGPHMVPVWLLDVTVSGQSSVASLVVRSRPPSDPTLTFDRAPNGTHYFLLLTGTDFGPSVRTLRSSACGDESRTTRP